MEIDHGGLPEALRGGARPWIEHHVKPGDFLCAVIRGDLVDAVGRADAINRQRLPEIVEWFYNHAPAPCWGSEEKFEAWAASGRGQEGTP